jgi:hypothetical protein
MISRHCRPRLERLEGRDVPGNLTVTYAAASRTLTVGGDAGNNDLAVHQQPDSSFILSSATDSINNNNGPYFPPGTVRNITVRMLGGDDHVTLDSQDQGLDGPFLLAGNLSVNGGDGANTLTATALSMLFVGGNLTVTNGTNAAGADTTVLADVNVRGSVTVANGNGDSDTRIERESAGFSLVSGNLTVTNGTGKDTVVLKDTNVGGNFTVKNGRAGAGGVAGHVQTFNVLNTTRSYIRGNVSVTDVDGNEDAVTSGLFDVEVLGNLTWGLGTGTAAVGFDGFTTAQPTIVRGNLTVTGSGTTTVQAGKTFNSAGLVVGRNLTVSLGAGNDSLTLFKAQVGGASQFNLGAGTNAVKIDDTLFAGTLTLTAGAGNDTVNLDATPGTAGATTFERAVTMSLGAGDDTLNRAGSTDANQALIVLGSFVVHHGTGSNTMVTPDPGHESFPFHDDIQWVL